jgi:eukaryotic-like serine/threonine-protein kinase
MVFPGIGVFVTETSNVAGLLLSPKAKCMAPVLMETPCDPNIATCPTCGTLIDVAEQEPYAKIHCSSCGTWMRVRQAFSNFEITGVLGEGGQGLVLRAIDKKLKRNVAIKLMRRQYSADPIFVKRFESEARVTAGLNHPNIVKVFSFGEDRGLLYLAMEMVDQGSLDAVMQQLGKVPEDRVLQVGVQIAKGLQAGLEKGLIHRDIKPGNILFADEHTAKIVDFGLAVLVEKQHEEEGEVWATPYYVAPEKLEGAPEDFRSDMYSLAATLFHALAGRPPFIVETNSMSELKKIKSKPVHLLSFAPHVSNATAYVIEKALAVKPEDRFASYEEFIQHLEYAQNELRKRPKARTRPMVATQSNGSAGSLITIFAVLIVVAAGLFFALKRNGGTAVSQPIATHEPVLTQAQEAEAAIVQYNQARFKLVKGRFRPAAVAFRELYAGGRLPEPTHSWSGFHEGLSELFDGRAAPARNTFAALARTTPGRPGIDDAAGAFFQKFTALALDKEVVAPSEAESFDRKSYEALALLALGLKNWEAGAYAEAVALLRQFQLAEPEGSSAWVGEYRPLVAPYLEEHGLFSTLIEDLSKWETNPERAEAALPRIAELKEKIRAMGLRAELRKLEEELAPKVVAAIAGAKEAKTQKMAQIEAADEQALTEAKLKIKALCETYQFRDALLVIKGAEVKSQKHQAERELLTRRVEWLVQFKEQLIKDLTIGGYNGPLLRKNGTSLPGGVAAATETHLSIRIGAGSAMVQWHELTPASVLGMAKSFFKPALPPEALATRQWHAGVFCIFTELYNESQVLMGEAAMGNEEYRLHKALFFGQPAEPAPTPAPAPAGPADPAAPANNAPGTGLEMLSDSLNPNRRNTDESMIKGLRRPPQ